MQKLLVGDVLFYLKFGSKTDRVGVKSPILLAPYVTVVEYRLIVSVNIVSQFQSSTFWP